MCSLSPLVRFYFIIIIIIIIIVVVVVVDHDTDYWVYLSPDHLFQVYYKVRQMLLQSATAFLLQSATSVISKCERYYKVWQFYYKVRQLLQSATIIKKCDSTVWFWSKNGHFSNLYFSGNIGQENVFYDILERETRF